jgi:UDP-N-acetylmuramoyl-tripeptide--D-alanyl-D-alanine ligase
VKLTLDKVAEYTQGTGCFNGAAAATGYSIDTRTLAPGDLFFAIRSERDGHDFVEQALAKGAVAAVVDHKGAARFASQANLIVVEDTLLALQRLGAAVRRLWGRTLIGVTGSVGKTTTKEIIAHVLGAQFKVHKTAENFNNHLGLPLQLLRLEPEHEIAVMELGMSHAGEITALAELAQPEVGVVTNVAPVHLEFFDSICGIARAKYELIESLPAGGVAVLNADDEYVAQFGRDFKGRVLRYGTAPAADVQAENVRLLGAAGSEFEAICDGSRHTVKLPLAGRHNVLNALAAVAVALSQGMDPAKAVAALATVPVPGGRGERIEVDGVTLVSDCYNSNPKALEAMLEVLASLPATRRVVVAGQMLELGAESAALHAQCGQLAAAKGIDVVLGVAGDALHLAQKALQCGAMAGFVEDAGQAGRWMARHLRAGDVVLVKGSHGVHLERAIEEFQSQRANGANEN